MKRSAVWKVLTALALSLAVIGFFGGCSGRDNTTDSGVDSGKDGDNPTDDNPSGITICDLQNPASAKHPDPIDKEAVSIKGVVVTSPVVKTSGQDSFFVQTPAGCGADGAKWSGIFVFARDMAITAQVGDKVDIDGVFTAYYDNEQIEATAVNVVGTGTITPTVVTPSQVFTDGADAEAYEGVLLEIHDVTVANPTVLGTDGQPHGDFSVKAAGSSDELIVTPKFKAHFTYTAAANDAFDKIVGPLDYTYEEFRIAPRGCDDLINGSGTSVCPTCPDPTPTVTVAQIQNPNAAGHVAVSCTVRLENVVVTTPLVDTRNSFYVSDPAGGEWSGVFIYNADSVSTTGVAEGKLVTIEGVIDEYYTLTELKPTTITVTGDGTLPTPTLVTPAEVNTGGTKQENFEGVLVQVETVQTTDAFFPGSDGKDHGDFSVASQSALTQKLVVGWQFKYDFSCPPAANGTPCGTDQREVDQVFTRITGVMDFSYDNARLQPRTDADLVLQ